METIKVREQKQTEKETEKEKLTNDLWMNFPDSSMMNGGSTPEETAYFFDNLREYEQPIGSGNSEIIIVEFTTPEITNE